MTAFAPIPDHVSANFTTMVEAAKNGDLAVLSGADAATGEPRFIICAVRHTTGAYKITPFGHLSAGNPFEEYTPPPSLKEINDACLDRFSCLQREAVLEAVDRAD